MATARARRRPRLPLLSLEEPGEILVQRGPVDVPGAGAADEVKERVAVGAIVGERDQAVPGLDFRRIAGLAALDRPGAARERPVDRGLPEPEIQQPFPGAAVIDADELVD